MIKSRIRIEDWQTKEEVDVLVHSDEATEAIVLNDLDVEFIEQDHNESGVSNGNLDVIVDEGLINISWELV
jgi:hypothetical protein